MTEVVSQNSSKPFSIGFIGLGTMGYPIAGHLARAGHAVRVYELVEERAQAWAEAFGGAGIQKPCRGCRWCRFRYCMPAQ